MDDDNATHEFEAFASARLALVVHAARLLTGDRDTARELAVQALREVRSRWSRLDDDADRVRAALTSLARIVQRRGTGSWVPSLAGGLELQDVVTEHAESDEPTRDREADVRDALRSLTDRERIEVVLRYVGRLDIRSISRTVRRPRWTIVEELDRAVSFLSAAAGSTDLSADDALVRRALAGTAPSMPDHDLLMTRLMRGIMVDPPRRPHTPWVVAGVSGVVVLALIAGAAAFDGSRDDRTTSDPEHNPSLVGDSILPLPDLPQVPSGLKLVGFQGMMLTVPESWRQVARPCRTTTGAVVVYPRSENVAPCVRRTSDGPSASFGYAHAVHMPSLNRNTDDRTTDRVVVSTLHKTRGGYVQFVAMLDTDVVVAVRSQRPGVVAGVISSAQEVPPGYAVVPRCEGLEPVRAGSQVTLAGLTSQVFADPSTSGMDIPLKVVLQTPEVGTVLPFRSQVNLAVVPR